jgi:hypothetical protein
MSECCRQQYLFKNPNGYRCHSAIGIPFPEGVSADSRAALFGGRGQWPMTTEAMVSRVL